MAVVADNRSMLGPWVKAGLLVWWPVLLGLLILFVPTYLRLAGGAWTTEEQSHGPVILLAVIWLFWRDRARLANVREKPLPLAGSLLLGLGLLVYVVGRSQNVPIFETFSEIPILVGTILLLRGWASLKLLWIPIFYLIFIVPIPGPILDALTGPLKYQVSSIVEKILYFMNYPIARSGVLLTIGNYQLMVADACSGLYSMNSLTAMGLMYIYIVQHEARWRNWTLLLAILPIAFVVNVIRIIGLVLLTYYFGEAVGQGFMHKFTGYALFSFSIVVLVAFDMFLGLFVRRT